MQSWKKLRGFTIRPPSSTTLYGTEFPLPLSLSLVNFHGTRFFSTAGISPDSQTLYTEGGLLWALLADDAL